MISATDLYQPSADWRNVTVEKLTSRGDLCLNDNGTPKTFDYTIEESTGDLYGLHGNPDPAHIVAVKAVGIFLVTPIYTFGLLCANLLKMVVDITSIFWKVIPESIQNLSTKGIRATLVNAVMTVIFEIPNDLILGVMRICRTPFYAVALEVACLYAMFSPYEGRKWIGKIESQWHENTPYKNHLLETLPNDCVDALLFDNKVIFLAVCMQKMGNIHDKVGKLDKYKICKS